MELRFSKSREIIPFNPPISIEGSWTIVLKSLEINFSIFNTTEENNKFELYIIPDSKTGDILYEKVRDEIERDLEITDITTADLQDEMVGPI